MKPLKAFATIVGLLAVLFGVPLLLIRLVGWPGPDHLPGWEEIRRTVVQRDFGTNFLLAALALIGWLLWLQVVWATIWELAVNVKRVRSNARPRRAPLVAAPIGRAVGVSVMTLLALFAATGPGTALAVGPLQVSANTAGPTRAPAAATVDVAQSARTIAPLREQHVAIPESAPVSTAAETGARVWNVESGDNLWDIAESALGDGSRVDELIALNPQLSSSLVINPGDQIRLPADASGGVLQSTPATPNTPDTPNTIVVERGDNLWNLTTEKWGSTDMDRIERVAEANQIANPHLIYPGDVIDLTDPDAPPAPQEAPGRQTFDVEVGDNGVAANYADGLDPNQPMVGGHNGFAAPKINPRGHLPPPVAASNGQDIGVQAARSAESDESNASVLAWDLSLLLGGGLLGLLAARRRRLWRTLRGLGTPSDEQVAIERRLRAAQYAWGDGSQVPTAELSAHRWRQLFFRVGSAAAAAGTEILAIVGSEGQPVTVHFADAVELPDGWTGAGTVWSVDPVRLAEEDGDGDSVALLNGSISGNPAPAMTELGTTPLGERVFVNIEALRTLEIGGPEQAAAEIANAVVLGLASSESMSSAALIGVGIDDQMLLGHPGAMEAPTFADALTRAELLVGTQRFDEPRSSLRAMGAPYGEIWEPAIIIAGSDAAKVCSPSVDGVALVSAAPVLGPAHVLAPDGDVWALRPLGIHLTPLGVPSAERSQLTSLVNQTATGLPDDLTIDRPEPTPPPSVEIAPVADPPAVTMAEQSTAIPPIMVRVMGPVRVETPQGPVTFQRSKSEELLVWLAFHREASTRTGARGALWNFNIRETPFRNVISDLRQSLDDAAPLADGEAWLERTETELLPLHAGVRTDAEIVEEALSEARDLPPQAKVEKLEPVVDLVVDMPFAEANYLWPDAEGLVSKLIMMASDAFVELADAHRSLGDADAAVAVSRRGLDLFSGHEGLVAVYLQSLVDAGDEEAVANAWNEYEATLCDDAWGPYEPSPELVALRRRLRQGRGAFAPPRRD